MDSYGFILFVHFFFSPSLSSGSGFLKLKGRRIAVGGVPLSIGADPWAPGLKPGRYTAGSDSELPVFLVWAAMPEGTTEGGYCTVRTHLTYLLSTPSCPTDDISPE